MEDHSDGSWKQEYEGKETRKEPHNFLILPTAVS